ncbi:MAG: hypothetical protein H7269_02105 [Cellulomonas sp.]|nr:hypothetical protein [Cellulomonas sp.]
MRILVVLAIAMLGLSMGNASGLQLRGTGVSTFGAHRCSDEKVEFEGRPGNHSSWAYYVRVPAGCGGNVYAATAADRKGAVVFVSSSKATLIPGEWVLIGTVWGANDPEYGDVTIGTWGRAR